MPLTYVGYDGFKQYMRENKSNPFNNLSKNRIVSVLWVLTILTIPTIVTGVLIDCYVLPSWVYIWVWISTAWTLTNISLRKFKVGRVYKVEGDSEDEGYLVIDNEIFLRVILKEEGVYSVLTGGYEAGVSSWKWIDKKVVTFEEWQTIRDG